MHAVKVVKGVKFAIFDYPIHKGRFMLQIPHRIQVTRLPFSVMILHCH